MKNILCAALGVLTLSTAWATERARINIISETAPLELVSVSEGTEVIDPTWIKDPAKMQRMLVLKKDVSAEAWETVTVTFKSPEDTQVKLRLGGDFTKTHNIWVLVDDVKMEGATVLNGDFEELNDSGRLRTWNLQPTKEGERAEVITDADKAASGSTFVKAAYLLPAIQENIFIKANTPVTLSMQLRDPAPPAPKM